MNHSGAGGARGVKLKVDENIGRIGIEFLRQRGHKQDGDAAKTS